MNISAVSFCLLSSQPVCHGLHMFTLSPEVSNENSFVIMEGFYRPCVFHGIVKALCIVLREQTVCLALR